MKSILTLLFAALALFAWGPWVDARFVETKLKEATEMEARTSKANEPCLYKKILSSYRTAFGQKTSVEYDCFAPYTMKRDMFVSSFGTVHPLSKLKPTVEIE
jgi:hypothetical protein